MFPLIHSHCLRIIQLHLLNSGLNKLKPLRNINLSKYAIVLWKRIIAVNILCKSFILLLFV